MLPATSVILGFLRFKAERVVWLPSVISVSTPIPHRVILAQRASIAAPGRFEPFDANSLATHVIFGGFRLSLGIAAFGRFYSLQVFLQTATGSTVRLEALACFVHRVGDRSHSNIPLSKFNSD